MTDLEDGFYWVKFRGVWTPAEAKTYQKTTFFSVDGYFDLPARSFDEIDPRRIVREGGE